MIELLFFLFIVNACIPADEGWDCNVTIYVYEKQGILDQYWVNEGNEVIEEGKTLRGFHHWLWKYNIHIIRIHEAALTQWTLLGCNVLWHELLHARGLTHEEMSVCSWFPRANQLDFI